MPPRSASLSLAEPRPPSAIQDWVGRTVSEAVSEAKSRRSALLHVSTMRTEGRLPLAVFDSTLEDVHFFGSRDVSVLGVGAAKVFVGASPRVVANRARSYLRLAPADAQSAPLMGGWGFPASESARQSPDWRDFPPARWVVPALTLTSCGGETILTIAMRAEPSSDPSRLGKPYLALAESLQRGLLDQGRPLPALRGARSLPSRGRWLSLAKEAIDSVSSGDMKKVVLSRALSLRFEGTIPASRVVENLVSLNPDSTVFAIKRRGSVFVGATPERLLSAMKRQVEVDCLAASSPRGDDEEADEALGAGLLSDAKSSREHRLVVQAAVSALSPVSSMVEVPGAPVLKRLATIQHLYTPIKATLREGEDIWAAALALWPNPAIGGDPGAKAVRWIRRHEGLDRGWYSGVVGLMDASHDEARLAVAIRSGLIRGSRALIYAGAGLVAGSEPEAEFEETGWKLLTMSRALGVESERGR